MRNACRRASNANYGEYTDTSGPTLARADTDTGRVARRAVVFKQQGAIAGADNRERGELADSMQNSYTAQIIVINDKGMRGAPVCSHASRRS